MFTSPAFTTNPTAPTQTGTDDSTKLATTQFVQARITDIIGNAGSTLDTLGELSASLAEDSGSLSTLTTVVGTKLAKASNLSDLQDAATARGNLGVDAAGTVNYVLPTNLAGDDIDIDTTPLTGATVISDLDINITTNTSGLVTDANGTVATRTLTATDLSLGNVTNESKATMFTSPTFTGTVGGVTAAHVGLGSSDDVTFNKITGSGIEITGHLDVDGNINGNRLAIGTGSADVVIHAKGTGNSNRIRLEEDTVSSQLTLIDVIGVDDELAGFGFGGSTHFGTIYKSRAVVLANTNLDGVSIVSTNTNGSIVFGVGSSPSIGNTERARVSAEGIHITGSLGISGDGSNGATLTESGNGDFDIVSVDDLRFTAGGNDIVLKGNNGDEYGRLSNDSQNLIIKNITSDKDISFVGKDDATDITALTLDMSNGGSLIVPNGKISTIAGNNLTISGTVAEHAGISFATNSILPCAVSAETDNIVDLGQSGNSYKDLYLGGGIFLGGTTTANKLNDYEEDTWTPTITNSNGTLVVAGYDGTGSPAGQYTKVGRLVTLFLQFEITDLDGASSGPIVIGGLPFNCTLAGGVGGQGVIPSSGKTLNVSRHNDTSLNSFQADGSFAGTGTHPTSFVIHYNV